MHNRPKHFPGDAARFAGAALTRSRKAMPANRLAPFARVKLLQTGLQLQARNDPEPLARPAQTDPIRTGISLISVVLLSFLHSGGTGLSVLGHYSYSLSLLQSLGLQLNA